MTSNTPHDERLRAENAELRARLQEAEETLRAVRSGGLESLVNETEAGPRVFAVNTAASVANPLRSEILAQVSDAVGMIDNDERIIFLNPAFERMYRVQASDMLGRKLNELYRRRWLKPGDEAVGNATLREHGAAQWELIHITRDGRELHVQSSVCLMRDATGNVTGIIAAIRDISERQRTEEALRESEAAFRAAFEQSAVGMAEISAPTRQFLRVNAKFCELTGYSAEALAGMTPADLDFAEDREADVTGIGLMLRGETALHEIEKRYVRKDGEIIWVCVNATLRRDAAGNPERTMAIVQDITVRKQVEQQLRDSEERLQLAIRAGGLGIWETNFESGQRHWSPEAMAMFGLDLADGIGRFGGDDDELLSRVHQDDRHLHDGYGLDLSKAGSTAAEYRIVLPNGDLRWLAGGAMVLTRDAAGAPVRTVHISADITARKQAEETLREREHFLQRIIDVTPGVLVVFDLEKQCSFFNNRTVASVVGYSVEEIAAMGANVVPTLMHPDDCARFPAHLERVRALRDDESADFEHRMRDRAGEWHWFQNRDAVFARDAAGAVCQLVGMAIEITAHKRAEAALQASETFSRTVLESSPDCVKVLDGEGRVTFMNANGCCLMEVDDFEAMRGQPWVSVWPEAEQATVQAALARAKGGEMAHFQAFAPTAKGTPKWWDVIVSPPHSGEGDAQRLVSVSRDITEQRHAERAVRESEERFRVLATAMPQLVWACSGEGECTFLGPQWEAATGQSCADGLGYAWLEMIHPHDRERTRQLWQQAVAEARIYENEYRLRTKAGSYRWFLARAERLTGFPGAVQQWIGTSTDIEQAKRTTALLKENEQRVRLATEATAVGIWEWKVGTGAIRWDAQMFRIYGIAPTMDGFVPYSDWSEAVLPEDLPEYERELTVRDGSQRRREFRIRRRDDGEIRNIEIVETLRTNERGEADCVIGTNLDVTDRNQTERELRQSAAALTEADRRKVEFLATLAHELRNPLAPIRTGVALLRMTEDRSPQVDALATMIERQVGHIVRLVDDLMDVSRVTTGKVHLQRQRVPVATVVGNAVEAVSPLMTEMGHALTVTLPPAPMVLDVDPVRMTQVISNLLNNAAKFTDRGGRIGLTVAEHPTEVVISVTDTGVGLTTADAARIFDLFAQIDPRRGHAQGGLGIGLALSKRLVEMHGGTIHAVSDGAGLGSAFVVRLPQGSGARPAVVPSQTEGHSLSGRSRRILVVDDNEDGADMLTMMLGVDGHDIRTAYDGQTAVDVADAFRPEVVLLDIGLPTMDGYAVCRHLRAQTWATGLMAIAMTGWGAPEDRRRAEDAGFDHHLVKPVDLDALRRLLATPVDHTGAGDPLR